MLVEPVAELADIERPAQPGEFARPLSPENLRTGKWRLAVDVVARTPELPRSSRRQEAQTSSPQPSTPNSQPSDQSLATSAATVPPPATQSTFIAETHLHAVESVPSEGRDKAAQFILIRFVFFNKLGKDDKLLLAFDAFVLSASLGREVSVGKIIHGDDHATLMVKTSVLTGEVRKPLEKIAALLSSPVPPNLVLNRHCAECEFQAPCRQKALEKDDLSLLAGMSAKERHKLRSKGIFTVTQLSILVTMQTGIRGDGIWDMIGGLLTPNGFTRLATSPLPGTTQT